MKLRILTDPDHVRFSDAVRVFVTEAEADAAVVPLGFAGYAAYREAQAAGTDPGITVYEVDVEDVRLWTALQDADLAAVARAVAAQAENPTPTPPHTH